MKVQVQEKRPWYIWVSAGIALLIALSYLLRLDIGAVMAGTFNEWEGLFWIGTISITCIVSAIAFLLKLPWGKNVFLVACLLLSARLGLLLLFLIQTFFAPYFNGWLYNILGLGGVAFKVFIYVATAWVAFVMMRRQSNQLAILGGILMLGLVIFR